MSELPKCPECENPYMHLCTDGSQFCDDCGWNKAPITEDLFQKKLRQVREKIAAEKAVSMGVIQYYPGIEYQELFEHMINEHNVILLQSQMTDLILIVKKFLQANPNY